MKKSVKISLFALVTVVALAVIALCVLLLLIVVRLYRRGQEDEEFDDR